MRLRGLAVLGLLLAVQAVALAGDWRQDWPGVRESLGEVEPWARTRWLTKRGLQDYYRQNSYRPESTGLRCIGRWSYGPSLKVSLRVTPDDTIVCLARGSGASIIRFRSRDSLTLDLLSDIDCYGIVSRAIIRDTLVYCGTVQGGTGIEVWGVSDLSNPHRLSGLYLPPVHDIAVKDTFLFTTAYAGDSIRVFNVADPRNPVQVGACSDSGDMMCVSGNYCYLGGQYGLFIIDVSDPASPRRVGSIGSDVISVAVRDTLCFFGSTEFALRVYNVRNPAAPTPVGSLSGIEASDIFLPPTCDTVLYTPKLHVINITNPRSPRQIGFVNCPGWDYGVTAVPALNYALVADHHDGLAVVDILTPHAPSVDTLVFSAGDSRDICIDQGRAYVAQYFAGVRILDITDPTSPRLLGWADTAGQLPPTRAVVARDSFAYLGWTGVPYFRAFDVTDPSHPVMHGGCDITNPPEDMVIRDTLVYVAEIARFQVVNVARPREPRLVGSCNTSDGVYFGLVVRETLAFIAGGPDLQVVNVANPTSPRVVGNGGRPSSGVAVRDTLAYIPYPYDTLYVYSTANPAQLRMLSATPTGVWPWDVALGENAAYVGATYGIDVFDLSDPAQPRRAGGATVPYGVRRLCYSGGLLYAALWEAGVAVYETTATGVAEPRSVPRPVGRPLRVIPNPAGDRASVIGADFVAAVHVYDAAGRAVDVEATRNKGGAIELNTGSLSPGVYFVSVTGNSTAKVLRVVRP